MWGRLALGPLLRRVFADGHQQHLVPHGDARARLLPYGRYRHEFFHTQLCTATHANILISFL
jgi:hypothetical protein